MLQGDVQREHAMLTSLAVAYLSHQGNPPRNDLYAILHDAPTTVAVLPITMSRTLVALLNPAVISGSMYTSIRQRAESDSLC